MSDDGELELIHQVVTYAKHMAKLRFIELSFQAAQKRPDLLPLLEALINGTDKVRRNLFEARQPEARHDQ